MPVYAAIFYSSVILLFMFALRGLLKDNDPTVYVPTEDDYGNIVYVPYEEPETDSWLITFCVEARPLDYIDWLKGYMQGSGKTYKSTQRFETDNFYILIQPKEVKLDRFLSTPANIIIPKGYELEVDPDVIYGITIFYMDNFVYTGDTSVPKVYDNLRMEEHHD